MSKSLNILLVEDDPQAQHLLERAIQRFFKDKPIAVFSTDSLEEAIQLERIRGPMAVSLIDLQLKDSEPENTMKHFLSLGKCVIAMSGLANGTTYRDCKRYGARDYIEKPIVIELLIEKIARILDNHEPGHQYVDIQREAQTQLAQKTNLAPAPVIVTSTTPSKWLRIVLPMAGSAAIFLSALGGFIFGGWEKAQKLGAEKQESKDTIARIETDVTEIKNTNRERDHKLETMRIDIAKLLVKSGLQPER